MRVRQEDDDPRLFAPDPVLPLWRRWLAFVSALPLVVIFVVGLPTASAVGFLWITGGWERVLTVWADRAPLSPWVVIGLIVAGSAGGTLALLVWHAVFVWSGFINERAFERYFDLTRPNRLVQALLAAVVVGGAFVWVVLKVFPA